MVKVDPDFEAEYPDGDLTSTEAYATLIRAGVAATHELDRCIAASVDMPQAAVTALAVLDGAGEALTPSQIADRVLVASATMTATLDLLERRGWIRRSPNPDDRRSVLVEITPDGRAVADRLLPGIHKLERSAFEALTKHERAQLLRLLDKVLGRLATIAAQPPQILDGERVRPARLDVPGARHPG